MNAVVYARYSSHKQGEQSIEGQLAAAYKYAGEHGYTIIHEYCDRAQTGRNDDREQFQQMLKDTAKKQFEAIIIWKIDCFGRNREEIAFNKYRCKKNGVKVLYTAESIPDTPEGIILEAVLEGMAEYYSVQLATNVKRGMDIAASKGQSVGGTIPLGYRTGPDKHLEPDPETAPLIKRIFEMYAAGSTQKEIIDSLNAEGLRTRKGKPLTVNSIRAVLKNKKYMGVFHYNGKEYPDAYIPALIDVETFDKVQHMLIQNRRAPAKKWTKAEYLLTGKLFCGLCGQTMIGESGTGKSGTRYHYYNCLGKKNHSTCKKRAVRKAWIEELVLAKAKSIVMSDEMIDFIAQKTYDYYVAQNTDTSYTDSLHAELNRVNTATTNLIRAMEAGIFNNATRIRMEELDTQKRELEAALANAELVSGLRLTQEHIKFFLLQFRQMDFDEPDSQRRIIDIFINAVFVYDDKVTITFNYSGDNRTITLAEVDAAARGVHGLSGVGHHDGLTGCQDRRPVNFIYKVHKFRKPQCFSPLWLLFCERGISMKDIEKSTSIRAGLQKGFRDGTSKMAQRRCYGYDTGSDGELAVNPDEATVVRWIFDRYLSGDSLGKIAAGLEEQGIPSPTDKPKWSRETLNRLLSNEKYTGRVLLQKTISVDGSKIKNDGSMNRYLISNSHKAIISDEVFKSVQQEKIKRTNYPTNEVCTRVYDNFVLLQNFVQRSK